MASDWKPNYGQSQCWELFHSIQPNYYQCGRRWWEGLPLPCYRVGVFRCQFLQPPTTAWCKWPLGFSYQISISGELNLPNKDFLFWQIDSTDNIMLDKMMRKDGRMDNYHQRMMAHRTVQSPNSSVPSPIGESPLFFFFCLSFYSFVDSKPTI